MSGVTVYRTRFCVYCDRAKRLLTELEVDFEQIDLTQDHARRSELMTQTGHRTVPMIFVGETFVGGFDDLWGAHRSGTLKQMFQSEGITSRYDRA